MEQVSEHKRNTMWYTLPILGAAVPAAVILARHALKGSKKTSWQEDLLHKSHIGIQDAMDTATQFVPGTPVEIELEQLNGTPVWQVEIVPQKGGPLKEVLIDAKNGSLLEMTEELQEEAKW